jgi:predicted phosphodiesterase
MEPTMRVGLLADIHEAVESLREALALFRQGGVERVVHLGDICARHRRLDETVALLHGLPAPVPAGGHPRRGSDV